MCYSRFLLSIVVAPGSGLDTWLPVLINLNILSAKPRLIDALPPHLLVLFSVVAIQLGAGVSTRLFPLVGVEGTVAIRVILSAVILWLFAYRRISSLVSGFRRHWRILLLFGVCMAAMNFCFFKAIERIPLGVAVAIEFVGPLSVSALLSKHRGHLVWVALAFFGILLLTPAIGSTLDMAGVVYAVLSGIGWGGFSLLSRRVSGQLKDNDGLVLGLTIAAMMMLPFALSIPVSAFVNPQVLLIGFLVALLSTAIPFTLEFEALKRLSATTYGVLVSTEPAVAAMVGAVLLGELIGIRGLVAVACVVVAAIGITLSDTPDDDR